METARITSLLEENKLQKEKSIEEIDKAYADAIERVNEIKQQLSGSGFGIDGLNATIN
jgi:hypothetical protein